MSELESFIVLYNGKFIRAYKESEADMELRKLKHALWMARAWGANQRTKY